VTDTNQPVELEGGEVIINKEASKKHWKELSRINQSAGGGVPILPPDDADSDVDENAFGKGGRTIEFNRNHIPRGFIYNYAKKIKEKYPKVWDMGGNIFGNEAYKNLERAYKRGYWLDSEDWMYKKWQSFNARHSGDIRIAGIIANLKWLNVVDKGWQYMKDLIQEEIDKKYGGSKMAKGGIVTYKEKYNKKYGYKPNESHTLDEVSKDTGVSKKGVQQIYNKGIGAYKTNPESVRPNVKSKEQWAMARVYSAVMGGKASRVDANELKMQKGGNASQKITCENCGWTWNTKDSAESDKYICHKCGFDNSGFYAKGGELAKGIKVEKEHIKTAKKLFNREITPEKAAESVAREHLKEDPNYYTKLIELEKKMAGGGILGSPVFQMKTPTGKPSKLTYVQQVLVRTKNFKDWFGDWEAAAKEFLKDDSVGRFAECFKHISKVMDWETLEPRVVYHGTRSDEEFFVFNTGDNPNVSVGRPYGYFAYNLEYAENFSRGNNDWAGMYNCFVNIKDPLLMIGKVFEDKFYDDKNWIYYLVQMVLMHKYPDEVIDISNKHQIESQQIASEIYQYVRRVYINNGNPFPFWRLMAGDFNKEFKNFMIKNGFDGVIYTEECCLLYDTDDRAQFTKAVTIFNPNQVKLADGRNTQFGSTFDDMRFETGGNVYGANLKSVILGNKFEDGMEYEEIEPRKQTNKQYLDNILKKMQQ
jgi:hypothetical protein